MSPRPRKASDDQIFAAAYRIMQRLGPAQWTLADIATEAGLTAGALVQRFGSKRELLVAITAKAAGHTKDMFAELRTANPSPLDTLRAYGDCIAQMGETPRAFAHHLAYLQLDLTDPDLHRHVRAQARACRTAIRALLDEAVAEGELAPSLDTAELARAVEVTLSGSLMTWAFYQEGSAATWLRRDLETLLRRFLREPRTGNGRRASASNRTGLRRPRARHRQAS